MWGNPNPGQKGSAETGGIDNWACNAKSGTPETNKENHYERIMKNFQAHVYFLCNYKHYCDALIVAVYIVSTVHKMH